MKLRLLLLSLAALPAFAQTRASAVFIDGTSSQVLLHGTMSLSATAYDNAGAPISSARAWSALRSARSSPRLHIRSRR